MVDPVIDLTSGERRRSSRVRSSPRSVSDTPERETFTAAPSSNAPEGGMKSVSDDTPQTKRNLRQRKSSLLVSDPIGEAMKALTDDERRNWKGWVELESDPALFSYILRSYGVKDVKIQEVFSLDLLSDLPKPVYGLIFLFKYRDDDAEEVEGIPKCPKHVWFANQTTENACATVALLNIVMNVPQIELGDALNHFKDLTKNLKPAYRGQRLSCDDFIRTIHNSFVRRMDILNADLALSNEFDTWVRAKRAAEKGAAAPPKRVGNGQGKGRAKPKAKPKPKKKQYDEEAGYHFIAYVPINGAVWRLDGLQRQPINIGESGEDWMDIARDNILQRIAQYEGDGIEYSLMSLCRSPLRTIREDLARNMKSISAVEQALPAVIPDWEAFLEGSDCNTAIDLYESFEVSPDLIDNAISSDSTNQKLVEGGSAPTVLLELRKSLGGEQARLRAIYAQEVAEIGQENEQAERRKQDYTPTIYNSIKALAEAGELKDIVLDLRGE